MTNISLRDGSITRDRRLDLIRAPHRRGLSTHPIMERVHAAVLDEANEEPSTRREMREWIAPRDVLDQGSEGACVGHAFAADAGGSPRRLFKDDTAGLQALAFDIYHRAQAIDEYPDPNDGGTSLQAGAAAAVELGHFPEYAWAASVTELAMTLLHGKRNGASFGPAIIAVEWTDGMYEAPDGMVTRSGSAVGWHALWVRGVILRPPGRAEPHFLWRNSWGPGYGRGGDAWISASDLELALGTMPEILVPIGRAAA